MKIKFHPFILLMINLLYIKEKTFQGEEMALTYKKAGVDEEKAYKIIQYIKRSSKQTFSKDVIGEIGFFGGFYNFRISQYREPILVSSCDGVGSKILVAEIMEKFDTIGIDLVAMNCNDVSVSGAKPLFFLDYLAVGEIKEKREKEIMKGIVKGCKIAKCAFIGGETAQLLPVYGKEKFDLAGFCVGVVERKKILPKGIKEGDRVIGVGSNGVHSNGFSLIRKIFYEKDRKTLFKKYDELGKTLGEELLKPTYIYSNLLFELNKNSLIKSAAHITGGGIPGNLIRVLPSGYRAVLNKKLWEIPPIFHIVQKEGKIKEEEMFKVFNMGLGLIVICDEKKVDKVMEEIKNFKFIPFLIGEISRGKRDCRIIK